MLLKPKESVPAVTYCSWPSSCHEGAPSGPWWSEQMQREPPQSNREDKALPLEQSTMCIQCVIPLLTHSTAQHKASISDSGSCWTTNAGCVIHCRMTGKRTILNQGGWCSSLSIKASQWKQVQHTAACLFWMVSFTVILRPFQSPVALAMSSPTFLGDWWQTQRRIS